MDIAALGCLCAREKDATLNSLFSFFITSQPSRERIPVCPINTLKLIHYEEEELLFFYDGSSSSWDGSRISFKVTRKGEKERLSFKANGF